MTVIQPPGVQWVVSLLQLQLGYVCDIFTPRDQPQETNFFEIYMSLQLMDPNCKPIHARAYTVPRSVEQQLQQSKEIVNIGGHWSP
jgi:hypothetical protein